MNYFFQHNQNYKNMIKINLLSFLFFFKQKTINLLLIYFFTKEGFYTLLNSYNLQKKMQQKNQMFQDFLKAEELRSKLQLTNNLQETLDYIELVIRKENDSLPKERKIKTKKEIISNEFTTAFGNLNKQERIQYYINMVDKIMRQYKKQANIIPKQDDVNDKMFEVFIRRLRIWKTRKLQIDRKRLILSLYKQEKAHTHDLNNYIFRKSKNNQYYSFVLEAINSKPASKYKTIHIGFKQVNQFSQMFEELRICIDIALLNFIRKNLSSKPSIHPVTNNQETNIINIENHNNKNSPNPNNSIVYPKSQIHKIKAENIEDFIVKPTFPPTDNNLNKSNNNIILPHQKKIKQERLQQQGKNNQNGSKSVIGQNNKKDKELLINNVIEDVNNNYHQESRGNRKSITQAIMESSYEVPEIEMQEDQFTKKNIKKPNLFDQILPDYNLQDLTNESDMVILQCQQNRRLLQNNNNKQNFKLFLTIRDFAPQVIFHNVTYLDGFKLWNSEVEQIMVKNLIASENTAIIYQKLKAYSKIYRSRDFVYLRHAFRKDKNIYIIDKSIENVNYPPFLTIVRGVLRCVWGIIPKDNNICLLVIDVQISNEGYLNEQQNINLSMQYLRKLFYIETFITQKAPQKDIKGLYKMFDIDNMIEQQSINEKDSKEKNFKKPVKYDNKNEKEQQEKQTSEKIISNKPEKSASITTSPSKSEKGQRINQIPNHVLKSNQEPINIQTPKQKQKINEIEEEKGEISDTKSEVGPSRSFNIPALDANGLSIINHGYLKVNHKMTPWQREVIYQDNYKGHHIWKGEWSVDHEKGGMWYVDQKKMAQQKKVLKYIISKIGKNLFSGKGILNISLPVDIFCPESNLERLAMTFAFAPIYLEKAAKLKDPKEQLKEVFIFGISTSLLYLNMEKPFNPILGETFQCSFKGCPVFLEQVSHHPPIAAFYMVGRGYKFYGSIQSKMQLHINSGCGINDGDFVIQFQNGTEFRFRTPGGEISGLTYGERKLNLVGKSFYWEPKLGYFLDVTFNPGKKGFFSLSKQQIPTDYFEGTLKKVKKEFLIEFKQSQNKQSPNIKDILEEHFKFSGNWNKQIMIDGKKVYDLDSQKYIKLEYEPNPLPSDANYRQDIIYRRLNNINRSQNEKEKYQIIQRKDRKLRQSHLKKK